jgi:hypothetical protein
MHDPALNTGEQNVSVHFPRHFLHPDGSTGSSTYYDSKPDWYSATVPRLAIPTDIVGTHIFTATSAPLEYPMPESPASNFQEWVQHLPLAEKRLISTVYFSVSDAEQTLIQYLQLECTVFKGTDRGKKHHRGSFSWIICSPAGHKQLVLNAAGPRSTRCQSSSRSEAVWAVSAMSPIFKTLFQSGRLSIMRTFS